MEDRMFDQAQKHLSRRDKILRRLIKKVGPCTLKCDTDGFRVLVRSIVSQQISTKAAQAICNRLFAALGRRLRPAHILEASDDVLRPLGLSASKVKSLRDLAAKCDSGEVPMRKLSKMEDEEVINALIPVRGIGRWTAEMFLIFSLGRLDVLPVADYGLRAGVQREYELEGMPGKVELEELSEPWRPFRSVGTWYVWRSLGFVPQSEQGKK